MSLLYSDDLINRAYSKAKQETKKVYALVFLQRQLSLPLSYFVFVPLGIAPNVLTVFSMVLGVAGAYLLATGAFVAGSLGLIAWGLIDCCDGEVARLTGRQSAFGEALETLNSNIQYVLWLPALSYGLYADGRFGVEWVLAALLSSALFNAVRGGYGAYPQKYMGEPTSRLKRFVACQFKNMHELRREDRFAAVVFYGWRNVVAQHGLFELIVLITALAFPSALSGVVMFYVVVYTAFSVVTIAAMSIAGAFVSR